MIRGFRDGVTESVFLGECPKGFPAPCKVARRKLRMVDAARELKDLLAPPGNRLEKLAGDREGQHSIRINDQYRVCFRWDAGHAYDVEITDYH